jgi:cbb3-type cytochrome oxidase maturation protein
MGATVLEQPDRAVARDGRSTMLGLTLNQFLVALCMSMAALCIFIWAVLSGLFKDVEEIKMRAYRAEVDDDEEQ